MKGWTLETEARYFLKHDISKTSTPSGVWTTYSRVVVTGWGPLQNSFRDVGRHDFIGIPRTPQSRHQKTKQKSRSTGTHFLRVFGMGDCHRCQQ